MAIWGIEGGIGTGKTLSMINLLMQDIDTVDKVYSNIKLTNLTNQQNKKIVYLTSEIVDNLFEQVKTGKIKLINSRLILDEAHNYVDSRNSASKKNKVFSYFVLQSRHFGKGSLDILYTTQELGQVDIRLRRQTDYICHPYIIESVDKVPTKIKLIINAKIKHEWRELISYLDVTETIKKYDTHEIIDFSYKKSEDD